MNRSLDSIVLRYAGYALLFSGFAYLLYLVRGALPVFLIAGLIAYALEPVLLRLERRGYTRRRAVGLVFLVFLLLFCSGVLMASAAWQQAQTLSLHFPAYADKISEIVNQSRNGIGRFQHLPKSLQNSLNEAITEFQTKAPAEIEQHLQAGVTWMLSSLGLLAVFVVVMPIVTFWMMLEMSNIRARILMIVPPNYRGDVVEIVTSINELLGRYVRGQAIVCSLFGVLCTIDFHVLHFLYGMEYPLVLGILAALIYIVPYVGMATIALSAGLTAYFTSTSSPATAAVIAVVSCVVFNLTIDYGISPRVLGRGVGLHPLMVIFALLCGAQLGGILGMILAVPFVASLKVVVIYLFPQLGNPIPEDTSAGQLEAGPPGSAAAVLKQSGEPDGTVFHSAS